MVVRNIDFTELASELAVLSTLNFALLIKRPVGPDIKPCARGRMIIIM